MSEETKTLLVFLFMVAIGVAASGIGYGVGKRSGRVMGACSAVCAPARYRHNDGCYCRDGLNWRREKRGDVR